jgi:hypothetical protein
MEMKEKTDRAKSMGRHAEKCWLRSKREIDIWAASLRRFISFSFSFFCFMLKISQSIGNLLWFGIHYVVHEQVKK